MGSDLVLLSPDAVESVQAELGEYFDSTEGRRFKRLLGAALGGIPWVGGLLSGVALLGDQERTDRIGALQYQWLEEHHRKLQKLGNTLAEITERLEGFGEQAYRRTESEGYLGLVTKGFRIWDRAETEEKRDLVRKLLTNAGADSIDPDDLIRLFLDWIDRYHELHFRVIQAVYKNADITRKGIWDQVHGADVREDSAEADLFRRLMRDLSTDGVLRQKRERGPDGQFVKKTTRRRRRSKSPYMKSSFNDTDPYELTELGAKFVHYCMDDVVPRVTG